MDKKSTNFAIIWEDDDFTAPKEKLEKAPISKPQSSLKEEDFGETFLDHLICKTALIALLFYIIVWQNFLTLIYLPFALLLLHLEFHNYYHVDIPSREKLIESLKSPMLEDSNPAKL